MPDETQIKCPHCGQTYAVRPEQWAQYHGRTINCTKCGQSFTVTAPDAFTNTLPPAFPPAEPVAFGNAPGTVPTSGVQSVPYGNYQNTGYPIAPTESNGFAVASLILGIVSFCMPLIAGIAAIVTGIIGLTKTSNPRVGGKGLAIAGISLGGLSLLSLPLLIAILLPALNRAREQANRVKCASDMKQIGLAIAQYENDNQLQLPPDLQTLESAANLPPAVFLCPSSNDTPALGATPQAIGASLGPGHLSYVYVGAGLTGPTATRDVVILYEPLSNHRNEGTNVLFGDLHVEWIKGANAQSILTQQAAGTTPIRLTTSP